MMKTLTKIKLINWQGFYDETIDVKGSILVTGENGSGKSSLIDALYFLLTGGDYDKFNAAANEKNDRSVESYMRGRTGEIGNPDLRPAPNVVSHIALEFFDEESRKSFVLGVVLEIQESRSRIGRGFYYFKNRKMDDELFAAEKDGKKSYLNFAAMKKKFQEKMDDLGDTKESARKAIYAILSLEGNKYYELLPKAMSFKPIEDVGDFVYKFLMPEKNVSIDQIRENIRTYNETLKIVNTDKEKTKVLENIITRGDEYRHTLEDQKLVKAYQKKKAVEKAESTIAFAGKKISEEEERQKRITADKEANDKELDGLKETKYSIVHQEAYVQIQGIKKDLQRVSSEVTDLERKSSSFSKKVLNEKQIASAFGIATRFSHCVETEDFSELKGELLSYKAKLDKAIKDLREECNGLSISLTLKNDKLNDLKARKEKLSQGVHPYDSKVEALIEVIHNGLKKKYNVEVNPKPFCELLDISSENEEWRNALEGYLNTRRFDLFVPIEYFDESLRLYEKYKIERHISGVGLVNVAKLTDDPPLPNSLATKVTALTNDARLYANYLLGQVICVDSEDNLKQYPSSITRTVMVYKNKAARQTKKEVYETPYIGRNSIQIQLKNATEKINKLSDDIEALNKQISNKDKLVRTGEGNHFDSLYQSEDYWQQKHSKQEEQRTLSFQYDQLKESEGKITAEVDAIQAKIKEAEDAGKKLNDDYVNSQKIIAEQNASLKVATADLEKSKAELKEALRDSTISHDFESFYQNNSLSEQGILSRLGNDKQILDRDSKIIIAQMQDYITRFQFDAVPDIDSIDDFYNEYNNVVKRNLVQYEDRLKQVRDVALQTFQNSYIADIRNNIRTETENIKKLNKILDEKPFGAQEEKYKFEISKSKDPVFGQYYDIFKTDQDYSIKDLFTEQLNDSNLALMNELFQRLTAETSDEKQLTAIREFTDYRRFMSYDIIITNKYGKSYRFSKISKSKSGGETQTPFYVIIAASFDQIVKGGFTQQSKGCIVMFDEAFEKMDEAHVDSMMQYFRKLSIQPIIAVPSRNAKPIMPYVDTVIGLVKIKDRIFPRPRIKEDKQDERL